MTMKESNPKDIFEKGRTYLLGEDEELDLLEAQHCFEEAAAEGSIDASHNLGNMYFYGDIKTDKQKAVTYYRKAAEKGHTSAQNAMGLAY